MANTGFVLLVTLLVQSFMAFGHEDADKQGIMVTGECEREVTPDRVYLNFTIEELKDGVKESTEVANKRYNQLLETIKGMKLRDAVYATTEYSTRPHRVWENKKNVLKGYKTTITLKVETSEIKRAGEVLQTASKHSQERIQGPNPFVSKEKYQAVYRECLVDASKDANEKAATLAKALGIKLGKAFDVKESGRGGASRSPMPFMSVSESMSRKSAPANIEYDKQSIKLNLQVTYYAD